MPQKSVRHHYVPVFYLSRWAGEDGRLCELSRPRPGGPVGVISRVPDGAGFAPHLYSFPEPDLTTNTVIEDAFFRRIDQEAHNALVFMFANKDGTAIMPNDLRSAWSRFLMSLMYRSPARLAVLKERCRVDSAAHLALLQINYQTVRQDGDPETYEEAEKLLRHDVDHKLWALVLEGLVDNRDMGLALNGMRWVIVTVTNAPHRILTSDQPLCMPGGLVAPEAHVVLPVSPTHVFVATNRPWHPEVSGQEAERLARVINDRVVAQADRYVYDTDDRQARYVDNRLRRQPG